MLGLGLPMPHPLTFMFLQQGVALLRFSLKCLNCPGLPRWLSGKESACQYRRCRFDSWIGNPWRRKWQSTPEFLPGKSCGQRSLAGYSPWDSKRVGCHLGTRQQQL